MISINPDDIMKNYAIFQNILAKTKKDGEVVISKEDVLDREAFVKQIVDLAMVLSEKHKNCCFGLIILRKFLSVEKIGLILKRKFQR